MADVFLRCFLSLFLPSHPRPPTTHSPTTPSSSKVTNKLHPHIYFERTHTHPHNKGSPLLATFDCWRQERETTKHHHFHLHRTQKRAPCYSRQPRLRVHTHDSTPIIHPFPPSPFSPFWVTRNFIPIILPSFVFIPTAYFLFLFLNDFTALPFSFRWLFHCCEFRYFFPRARCYGVCDGTGRPWCFGGQMFVSGLPVEGERYERPVYFGSRVMDGALVKQTKRSKRGGKYNKVTSTLAPFSQNQLA